MQAEVKYWNDTHNLELHISANSTTEAALLKMLLDRKPHVYLGTTPEDQIHLIFPPSVPQGEVKHGE